MKSESVKVERLTDSLKLIALIANIKIASKQSSLICLSMTVKQNDVVNLTLASFFKVCLKLVRFRGFSAGL